MDRSDLTPLKKFLKNLSQLEPSSKIPLVFLVTGALNPIHNGHINLFRIAKRAIEKNPQYNKRFVVVAGFISPSQQIYVEQKLGNEAISIEHRIIMAKLAIPGDLNDWVDVDEWESKTTEFGKEFIDFPKVAKNLQEWLNFKCPQVKKIRTNLIRVIYLCGSDHVMNKEVIYLDEIGIFVVDRKNQRQDLFSHVSWKNKCEKKLNQNQSKNGDKFVVFENGENYTMGISSTNIRDLATGGTDSWENMCPPAVVRYIKISKLLKSQHLSHKL
jgi:nicotinic acid mononucleotide adenylyltransferase